MPHIEWSMKDLAECLKVRQKNSYDGNFVVDGPRGNGKSTFIFKLFTAIGGFKPWDDIVFSRDDVMKGLKEKKYGLIMADEMINAAHNREFFAGDQKTLIKMLNMYRDNFNILGAAVPFFYDLDPQVRKFIKMRITVLTRGIAVVQFSRQSMYTNDPWETDANKKTEMKFAGKVRKGKGRANYFSRLSTYSGIVRYGPMGKRQEEMYKKIKETKRMRLMEEVAEENEKEKEWIHEGLYNALLEKRLTKGMLIAYSMARKVTPHAIEEALRNKLEVDKGTRKIYDFIVTSTSEPDPSVPLVS